MAWPCHAAGSTGTRGGGDVRDGDGTGTCLGVQGIVWACFWRSGSCWSGVCRPGRLRCGHARKVLDRVLAGRAPANAGRGRGQEQGARVGEHLGIKGQLQDLVVQWLAAGLDKMGMVGAYHAMAAFVLGFRVRGSVGRVQRV